MSSAKSAERKNIAFNMEETSSNMSSARSQKAEDTDGNVLIFGAHVPNLLIQRSFHTHVRNRNKAKEPFIERFEGSLLFVDISGFTALSRQLHVESLKTHINAYFTKMLNVVDKHGGDVVKFAGDALYTIWPANELIDKTTSVKKALNCALEITSVCDSYKILREEQRYSSPSSSSPKAGKSSKGSFRAGGSPTSAVYLNVHVGLSVGTMAAVDIGCAGRWEMLLVGQPLKDVAAAESLALSGEVVISDGAHSILSATRAFSEVSDRRGSLRCESRDNGCYVVWMDCMTPDSRTDADDENSDDDSPPNRLDFVNGILREMHSALPTPKQDFTAWKLEDSQTQGKMYTMAMIKNHVHEAARSTAVVDLSNNLPSSSQRSIRLSGTTITSTDDLESTTSCKSFSESDSEYSTDLKRFSPPITCRKSYPKSHMSSPTRTSENSKRNSLSHLLVRSPTSSAKKPLTMDVNEMVMILTAELRKCTILFINISIDVDLLLSPSRGTEVMEHPTRKEGMPSIKSLPFIARSREELNADENLLSGLQRCMEIISSALSSNCGQIRQFIHDDKGTVCIGTIGLRGSATDDNAAAAVEAARSITLQLQAIGLSASIGIASGKAFCGLVGSSVRHEYAVMGPSVNLSARLMCAAAPGTILCDQTTKESDRRHKYVTKSAINAKGFDAPVSTFMPIVTVQTRNSAFSNISSKGDTPIPTTAPRQKNNGSCKPSSSTISFARSMSHETSSSEGVSEASADEHLYGTTESGLCGRSETLRKISFFAAPFDSLFGDLDSQEGICAGNSSKAGSARSLSPPHAPPVASKMKIAFISGPYGIGKTSVLKAAHHCTHIATGSSNGFKYKYHVQASAYNKTTIFFTFKKIITNLLLELRFHGPKNLSRDDLQSTLRDTSTTLLPTVHEDQYSGNTLDDVCGSGMQGHSATIVHNVRPCKGSRKQELIRANIHHIISLMDDSDRDLEPLLMNGFLTDRPMEHTDATKTLSTAERIRPVTKLLAGMLEKIGEALGGPMLFIIDDVQSMDHASWGLLRYMWKTNNQITVVCSFRTFGAQSVNYESEQGDSLNPIDPKDGEVTLENELANTFTGTEPTDLNDSVAGVKVERVLLIELAPLDEGAVADLVSKLLKEHCAAFRSHAKMLNAVYRLSGGNPLYAVEVSKAAMKMVAKIDNLIPCPRRSTREVAQSRFLGPDGQHGGSKFDDDVQATANSHYRDPTADIWEKAFEKVSSSLRSDRIEEIIIFRFDQLDSKSQLLLRIAAVAGFNNAPFSAKMLSFVLPHFSSARTQDELFYDKHHANQEEDDDFELTLESDDEDDTDKGCQAISRALNKILRESEFLRVCKIGQDSSDENSDGVTDTGTGRSFGTAGTFFSQLQNYEFVSSLVQAAILNLNLRGQNGILHFQTASYLESQIKPRLSAGTSSTDLYLMSRSDNNWLNNSMSTMSSTSSNSPSTVPSATWYRLGIHWQHSAHFVKAMACFYNSAVLLESIGSSRDGLVHLFKAYDMLQILREEAGLTTSDSKDAYKMISQLSSLTGRRPDALPIPLSLDPSGEFASNSDSRVDYAALMTREEIHHMFGGDILALDIAIKLLITLSQNIVVTLAQRQGRDTKYYSEALELAMASCKELITITSTQPTRHSSCCDVLAPELGHEDLVLLQVQILDPFLFDISDTAETASRRGAHMVDKVGQEHFYLRDFTSIFPILAGLTLRLLHGTKQDQDMIQKVDMMTSTFLALARQHGDTMHIIRALHLQSVFYSRINRLRESLANCDEITSLYVFEEHSFQMSKVYGGDRGVGAMAAAAVGNALLGRWSKALSLCETTERYLPRLTSVSVVGLSTHSIAIAYGMMGMHDRAHAVFTYLMKTEGKSSAFSIFRELNPYYHELYTKRAELCESKKTVDREMKSKLEREQLRFEEKKIAKEYSVRNSSKSSSSICEKSGKDKGKEAQSLRSLSCVVDRVMKESRAKEVLRRMVSEKIAARLRTGEGLRSALDNKGFANASDSTNDTLNMDDKIEKKIEKEEEKVRYEDKYGRKDDEDRMDDEKMKTMPPSPKPHTPLRSVSEPLKGTGTISFQLSLMTGRGMDSIKAELCMLNAITAMTGGEVVSQLNCGESPMTAEEYCEEGLRCIANIKEEPCTVKISNYSHTCDQVHTFVILARLYTILAALAPHTPGASQTFPSPTKIIPEAAEPTATVTATATATADSETSLTDPEPCYSPTPFLNYPPEVIKGDRGSYMKKAKETLIKCEILGRVVDAPGVLFITGMKMISLGIDTLRGREILTEAMAMLKAHQESEEKEAHMCVDIIDKEMERSGSSILDDILNSPECLHGSGREFLSGFIEKKATGSGRELLSDFSEKIGTADDELDESGLSEDYCITAIGDNCDSDGDGEGEKVEGEREGFINESVSKEGRRVVDQSKSQLMKQSRGFMKVAPIMDEEEIPIVIEAKEAMMMCCALQDGK